MLRRSILCRRPPGGKDSSESVTPRSYVVGMSTSTSTQAIDPATQTASEVIFTDPVSYLRTYGIEAVLVVESEAPLPAAA